MKKIICVVCSSLLLLNSCTKDNSSAIDPVTNYSKKSFSLSEILSTSHSASAKEYDPAKLTNLQSKNGRLAGFVEYGPFTVNGSLTYSTLPLRTNEKILLTANQSQYVPGIYFCDVFVNYVTVNIPANAYPAYQSASKIGYESYNGNQTEGVTRTEGSSTVNGMKTYTMATYSIRPRTNVSGQTVTAYVLPRDLVGGTFTYSYIQQQ